MQDVQYETGNTPVTGVVACIMVSDTAAAIRFWERAFGARELNRIMADDGKRVLHSRLAVNGGQLIANDAFPENGYPLREPQAYVLHLQVEDGEAAFARAVDAGATVKMPMAKMFWGDLYGQVMDPFGVMWSIGSTPKS